MSKRIVRQLYDIYTEKKKIYVMNVKEKSPSVMWILKENESIWIGCHREKSRSQTESVRYMILIRKWKDMEWMSQRKVHQLYDILMKKKWYGRNVRENCPSVIWYLKENERIWNECHIEKSVSNMIFEW